MRKTFLLFVLAMFSYSASSQNEKLRETEKPIKKEFKLPVFKMGVGVLIPQGNQNEYFGVSPMVEVGFDFPKFRKKTIGLFAQFVIPSQKEKFLYERNDDLIKAKATFMANIFLKMQRELVVSKNSEFNLGFGLGVSNITTDARNLFYEGEKDENKYESITTIYISPGIEFVKKFGVKEAISVGVNLQYSPYKVDAALKENIGSMFLVPRITYSF